MLYLITGGSGSGKSEYAERLAVDRHQKRKAGKLYYIATMYPLKDGETQRRIERHRSMRKDKGFETIECCSGLERITAESGDVLLLECMSNLLANEMYLESGRIKAKGTDSFSQIWDAILQPVLNLAERAGDIILVTNEVFSDGVEYEAETETYIRLLGTINQKLAAAAEGVVEVVCGIPLAVKGELRC